MVVTPLPSSQPGKQPITHHLRPFTGEEQTTGFVHISQPVIYVTLIFLKDFYRIFYLDADNVLSVRALSTGGDWKDGNLQDLKIKCAHDTKIAATCSSTRGQLAIRYVRHLQF